MKEYYVVAQKDIGPRSPHSPDWPKVIGYSCEDNNFIIMEGDGHGFGGSIVGADEVKKAVWENVFKELSAKWFIDELSRRNSISQDEMEGLMVSHGLAVVKISS